MSTATNKTFIPRKDCVKTMIMCKLYTSTGARHPIVRFCKKDHECTLNNVIDQRFWMLIWLSIFIQYRNSTHTYLFNLILVSIKAEFVFTSFLLHVSILLTSTLGSVLEVEKKPPNSCQLDRSWSDFSNLHELQTDGTFRNLLQKATSYFFFTVSVSTDGVVVHKCLGS